MARKRYISNTISLDSQVNRVAVESDFAALLYTWMIPHAEDDGLVPSGDIDELIMMVIPGRRDITESQFEDALRLLEKHDLVVWHDHCVEFPPAQFYTYQTYIKADKRRTESLNYSENPEYSKPPTNREQRRNRRQTANSGETADIPLETPENTASPSPSPSLPPSPSSEVASDKRRDVLWETLTAVHGEPGTRSERGKFNKAAALLREANVTPDEYPSLVQAYCSRYGGLQPAVMTIATRVGEMRHYANRGPITAPSAEHLADQVWAAAKRKELPE